MKLGDSVKIQTVKKVYSVLSSAEVATGSVSDKLWQPSFPSPEGLSEKVSSSNDK